MKTIETDGKKIAVMMTVEMGEWSEERNYLNAKQKRMLVQV